MAAFARLLSLSSPINLVSKVFSAGINNFFVEPACTSGILINYVQIRERAKYKRRRTQRPMIWGQRRRKFFKDYLTPDNKDFIQKFVEDKYASSEMESPLKESPWPKNEWTPKSQRTGVIAKKIGIYPMWKKDGTRMITTLLHVTDNHVIRYITPEFYTANYRHGPRFKGKYGVVVVGADRADPQKFTQQYIGLFNESGVMPKKKLSRFLVSPDAALQPGTPLVASHFRVGDYVDVYGKTVGHGFQGVMKRWNFRGGPATHGCTKNHRRTGNIGTGRQMARVWPGKKMPGHMGQERRYLRGLKVVRINTKYNVVWVEGPAVPGHVHHYVHILDTVLPHKQHQTAPPFPTHYPDDEEPLPEDLFIPEMHTFDEETLTYADEPEIVMPTASKSKKLRR